jgi:hypothetical protein
MKMNRPARWLTALVFCTCCLLLTEAVGSSLFQLAPTGGGGARANADDKASGKDRIKELQKQRLEAAQKANDIMVSSFKAGFLPAGTDATTFFLRLAEVKKLVLQAQLDLAETNAERIKAIEDAIKETEPLVDASEKSAKAGIGSGMVQFQLAQAHLLELKIMLEKAKLENGK